MAFPFRNLFGKTEDGLPHPDVPSSAQDGAPGASGVDPHGGLPFSPAPPSPVGGRVSGAVASPFQVNEAGPVRAHTFDAEELTAVIPAHLLSNTAPPQHRVTLQISAVEEDPINQVISTTLGKIYSACPHLFNQPISEANDLAIRLPMPEAPVEASSSPGPPELPPRTPVAPAQSPAVPVSAGIAGAGSSAVAAESPFMVVNTPATTVGSKQSPPPVPGQEGGASPFNALPPTQSMASPFQVAGNKPGGPIGGESPAAGLATTPVSGVQSTIPPAALGAGGTLPVNEIQSPFSQKPGPVDLPASPPAAAMVAPSVTGAQELERKETASGEPTLSFGLPSLLMRLDAATLGVEPTAIPSNGKILVPLMLVKSQLSSGRVSLSVAQLMQYADQASKPVLASASPDVQVTLPLKEIFRQLPADVLNPPKAETTTETPQLETPFSEGARQDAEIDVEEVVAQAPIEEPAQEPAVSAEAEEDESAAMMKAFMQTKELPEAPAEVSEPQVVEQSTSPATESALEPVDEVEPEVGAFPESVLDAELESEEDEAVVSEVGELDELGSAVEIGSETDSVVAEEEGSPDDGYGDMVFEDEIQEETVESVVETEAPQTTEPEAELQEPAVEPVAKVAPQAEVPAVQPTAQPKQSLGFGGLDFQGPLRDLELRAVFGTEDLFTPQRVAELTSGLQGIEGSVLFDREGRVFGEKMPLERAKERLPETMCRVFDRVTGLAADLGFETSEAFTIHTSHGVLSFYSEGDLCLSILHEETDLPAGTSEKLVLTLRGTKRLVDAGSQS